MDASDTRKKPFEAHRQPQALITRYIINKKVLRVSNDMSHDGSRATMLWIEISLT